MQFCKIRVSGLCFDKLANTRWQEKVSILHFDELAMQDGQIMLEGEKMRQISFFHQKCVTPEMENISVTLCRFMNWPTGKIGRFFPHVAPVSFRNKIGAAGKGTVKGLH
jgi:hypothetical protein